MTNQRAFDMPAMHIFKIWGGQIHEIEAAGNSECAVQRADRWE